MKRIHMLKKYSRIYSNEKNALEIRMIVKQWHPKAFAHPYLHSRVTKDRLRKPAPKSI